IADGTLLVPKKFQLQPTADKLPEKELNEIKKIALEKEVELKTNPQMSSEESNFKQDFELLDVAEGFFIYREIEFRAYLYTAYSQKMKRNYQGILVCGISNNGTKFTPKAHYVYEYRGDKYLRMLSDINGNVLSELAIFSEPPTKKHFRKYVRIIEFSPNGLNKFGMKEIYSSIPQKQRLPYVSDGERPKMIYTPPIVSASKLYYSFKLGKAVEFYEEVWQLKTEQWEISEKLRPSKFENDLTDYVELQKPIFPKVMN
ncbi:MAG TPA: hypothetical protein PKY59_05120, partial [Pyrinomonadaceae bacterium]|nr:hypothetical protein [Pyrinomonadaceae bacterium]